VGIRVDRPGDVEPARHAALEADRPVVLEAVVDPDVPPLPPHITFERAASMARALLMRELAAGVSAHVP
jgi:pyruvate dehydrogenase (quinone)